MSALVSNDLRELKDDSSEIHIDFAGPSSTRDTLLVSHITRMINDAYDVAERGYFEPGHGRTNEPEIARLIEEGAVALARTSRSEDEVEDVVGCVAIYKVSETKSTFGMLVARPVHRGSGIGLKLVQFAEHHARTAWRSTVMELQVLLPVLYEDEKKVGLCAWEER